MRRAVTKVVSRSKPARITVGDVVSGDCASGRDDTTSSTTKGELANPQPGIFMLVSDAALRDQITAPLSALSTFTIPVAPNV